MTTSIRFRIANDILLCFFDKIYERFGIKENKRQSNTEAYRSGHNGTDSKSVVPHGTVGSNPTASAKERGMLFSIPLSLTETVAPRNLVRAKRARGEFSFLPAK